LFWEYLGEIIGEKIVTNEGMVAKKPKREKKNGNNLG
jgi:hypothetical protein